MLQFTLPVLLMVAMMVVNAQLAFVQRQLLGYDKAYVLYFETAGRAALQPAALLVEVKKLPGIIVNQALVASLGMPDPVGQRLNGDRIVGVVRDFHYESLHEKIKPYIF